MCAATPLLQASCLSSTLDSNPTETTSPLHTGLTEANAKYISEILDKKIKKLLAAVMLLAQLIVISIKLGLDRV